MRRVTEDAETFQQPSGSGVHIQLCTIVDTPDFEFLVYLKALESIWHRA